MGLYSRRHVLGMAASLAAIPLGFPRCEGEPRLNPIKPADFSDLPHDVESLIKGLPSAQLQILTRLGVGGVSAIDQLRNNMPDFFGSLSARRFPRGGVNNNYAIRMGTRNRDGKERVLWWLDSKGPTNGALGVIYGSENGITGIHFGWDGLSKEDNTRSLMRVDAFYNIANTVKNWNKVSRLNHYDFGSASSVISGSNFVRLRELTDPNSSLLFEDPDTQKIIDDRFFGRA